MNKKSISINIQDLIREKAAKTNNSVHYKSISIMTNPILNPDSPNKNTSIYII